MALKGYLSFKALILTAEGLPSFKWSNKQASSSGVPLLLIGLENGKKDQALLERYTTISQSSIARTEISDSCIYKGYLASDPNSAVTLSGSCSDKQSFEVRTKVVSGI